MHGESSCGVQSATTSFAFEVFSLLMGDENLKVIEITLTVVAPGTSEEFLDIWVITLLLSNHSDDVRRAL